MVQMKIAIALLNLLSCIQSALVLAQSGSNSIITFPGSPRPATVTENYWGVSDAPDAVSIWSGPGNDTYCDQYIRVTQSFTPPCLHYDLTVYIKVDDWFSMSLNGFFVNQPSFTSDPLNYTVSTANLNCGDSISININATNEYDWCDSNQIASAIYAVVSQSCYPTDNTSYYDSSLCYSVLCSTPMTGCYTCSSKTVCTGVVNNTYGLYPNGSVDLCSNAISHCQQCSSASVCTMCVSSSYALMAVSGGIGCGLCSGLMTGCTTCSSNTVCTGVVNNTYGLYSNGSVDLCSNAIGNCQRCSSASVCTMCVSSSYALMTVSGGMGCGLCSGFMVGCATCSSNTVCTSVVNNTYALYSNGSVDLCSNAIGNCQQCSSTSACTTCVNNSYALMAVSGGMGCGLCSGFMVGCTTCANNATCIVCDTANNFIKNSSSKCVCNTGYILVNGACGLCSGYMTGCQSCSSPTVCTSVVNNSYVILPNNSVNLCSNMIANCQQCSSTSTCTTCSANFVPSSGSCVCSSTTYSSGSTCISCTTVLSGCQQCTSTTCISCGVAHMSPVVGVGCVCDSGYFLNNAGQCNQCNSPCGTCFNNANNCTGCIAPFVISGNNCVCPAGKYLQGGGCQNCPVGCSLCSSASVCSQCISPYTPTGSTCSCTLKVYFDASTSTCTSCHYSCYQCTSSASTSCTNCEAANNRTLTGQSCPCISPAFDIGVAQCQAPCITGFWDWTVMKCIDICGDGLLTDLECDDGNKVDGDGCSSTCTIEGNYTCVNGSATSPSVCSYNQQISLKLVDTIKDPTSNKISFYFTLSPAISALNSVDFLPLLSCNLPNTTLTVTYDGNGNLIVTAQYNSSLTESNATIQFTPYAGGAKFFFATPNSSNTFTVDPSNNLSVDYYDESVYEQAKTFQTLSNVLMYVALAGFVAGLLSSGKFIGVQMIGVIQASFIGLMAVTRINPLLAPLTKIGYINGVNTLYSDQRRTLVSNGVIVNGIVPYNIAALEYESQMAYSLNFTALILLLPPLMAFIFFIGSKITKIKQNHQKFLRWSWLALCEYGLTAVFFVLYHSMTSLEVFIGYGRTSNSLFIMSIVDTIIVLCITIPILVLFKTHPMHFGDYKLGFKQNTMDQLHYFLIGAARILLVTVLIALSSVSVDGLIAAFVPLGFGVYVTVKKPYISLSNNIRAISNEVILTAVLCLYGYCRISPNSNQMTIPYVIIGLLFVCLLYNIAMMLKYQFYDKKKQEQARETKQELKKMATIQTQQNQKFAEEMKKKINTFTKQGPKQQSKRQLICSREFKPENMNANTSFNMNLNDSMILREQLTDRLTEKLIIQKTKQPIQQVSFTKQQMEQIVGHFDAI